MFYNLKIKIEICYSTIHVAYFLFIFINDYSSKMYFLASIYCVFIHYPFDSVNVN